MKRKFEFGDKVIITKGRYKGCYGEYDDDENGYMVVILFNHEDLARVSDSLCIPWTKAAELLYGGNKL
jgi:hypothetical protein